MRKFLKVGSQVEKAARNAGHYPGLIVLLAVVAVVAIATGTTFSTGVARAASGATLSQAAALNATAATPLERVLNLDGTVNLQAGFTGSLDPAGWTLASGPAEEPRFTRTTPSKPVPGSPSAPGDEYWDARFDEPLDNSSSAFALATSGNDLYIAHQVTIGSTFYNLDRWNPASGRIEIGEFDGTVYALAVGPDGTLYAGGSFNEAGGVAAQNIAMWDGATWSPVGGGTDGLVLALVFDGDGDLYAGGWFGSAGGTPASRVAMWNGSVWSALGSGITGESVQALAIGSNGEVYAGGFFSQAGGSPASSIAMWNGTAWSALGSGVGGVSFPSVRALAASPNGGVYVGGNFTTAGGTPANYVALWNGSTWSALGSGTDRFLNDLVVASNGDVYAGGGFSMAGGVEAPGLARWNGSQWFTLGNDATAGFLTSEILALTTADNGDVYASGVLLDGDAVIVAGWNGSQWFTLFNGIGSAASIAIVPNGDVYAAIGNENVERWNGFRWISLPPLEEVSDLAAAPNGNIYASGGFKEVNGTPVPGVAMWNGTQWSPVGNGELGPFDDIAALAVASNGDLYVGGNFSEINGVPANNIARWNGSSWSALGSGISGAVRALKVRGSDLYAGGSFSTAGGVPANNIARWNGSSWSALGTGISGEVGGNLNVATIDVAPNGDVYAGGEFAQAGESPANNIARWNGSSWSALGSGTSGGEFGSPVDAIAIADNGDVYAGGEFPEAGGVTVNYIGKWNGSSWSSLGSGLSNVIGGVAAIAVRGSDVYVGGSFRVAGGKPSEGFGIYHDPQGGGGPTATPQATSTPAPSPTPCARGVFSDVPQGSTFQPYISCLANRDIISGYGDCTFRPQNLITRGQIAKIVSNSAGYNDDVTGRQTYTDVPPTSTFWLWIERLSIRGHMGGYTCGNVGEPCDGQNRPYFRPGNNATRGQLTKIAANAAGYSEAPQGQTFEDVPPTHTFYTWVQRLAARYVMGGYDCGDPGEPCGPANRPYFRPEKNVTRGQASKIVTNTFFPKCQTPRP